MEHSENVAGNLVYPYPRISRLSSEASRTLLAAPPERGFSLSETLIALSITGVLLGVGTPAMHSLMLNNRMTTEVNALMAILHTTRGEAIKRGAAVTICTSLNGTSCSNDSEWREGWIVFADRNENQALDEDEAVIRVQQGWQGWPALRYGGPKASYSYLTYYPEGYARQNATFTFCDARGTAKAKTIRINTVGRPHASTKDADNKPPNCSWASP